MAAPSGERIRQIFEAALRLPAHQRTEYVERACGDDEALKREVKSLLRHDAAMDSGFLRVPPTAPESDDPSTVARPNGAPEMAPAATCDARSALSPESMRPERAPEIEGYEILRELSRGGQGVVYQAIQRSTRRKVAIKVLVASPASSRSAERRFEREVELSAQLRHPCIIRVFDSGQTRDGRAYYVMDYVRGVPLHQYVREHRLTLEDTLRLFAMVCDAVQYAHQRGVIHRDLKPTNILVESDGSPKIMDFGLAKTLAGTDASFVSMSQELIGTLPYMSPEQARGNPDEIDGRTDIYALGVILYELLTGRYPYPVEGPLIDVLKHITGTAPIPPSRSWEPEFGIARRATRRFRMGRCPIDAELETIVLRALAKERDRRYPSVGDLAEDIDRYLRGEPITAKRDSHIYLLRRWARQHWMGVCAAFAGSVLLFVLVVGYSVLRSYKAATAYNAGTHYDAKGNLAQAAACYEQAVTLKPEFPEAWFNLGNVYLRSNKSEAAVAALQKACALAPHNTKWRAALAEALCEAGRWQEAERLLHSLVSELPMSAAYVWARLGDVYVRQRAYRQALDAYNTALINDSNNPHTLNALAWLLLTVPQPEARNAQRALELTNRLKILDPNNPVWDSTHGLALATNGRFADACAAAQRSLAADPGNPFDLAVLALCQEDAEKAEQQLDAAGEAARTLSEPEAIEALRVIQIVKSLLLHSSGRNAESQRAFPEAGPP